MNNTNRKCLPKIDKRILWRRDGYKNQVIVAVSKVDYRLRVLHPTDARIFELCDGKRTIEDISDTIASEFQAEGSRVEGYVKRCLMELEKAGLINF